METAHQIVVMVDQGAASPEAIAAYPIGSRGFEKAMFLIYDHSEEMRNRREDPSTRLWVEIGPQRWDHDDIIETSIHYDAVHYQDRVEILAELIERFAPDFVETPESRLSHLDDIERDILAHISIGTERQIKYAQGIFLDDERRERCMSTLETCMREIDQPDVPERTKTAASYLLSLVPTCSVFWIDQTSSDAIRMAILEQISGDRAAFRPEKVIKLGAQLAQAMNR